MKASHSGAISASDGRLAALTTSPLVGAATGRPTGPLVTGACSSLKRAARCGNSFATEASWFKPWQAINRISSTDCLAETCSRGKVSGQGVFEQPQLKRAIGCDWRAQRRARVVDIFVRQAATIPGNSECSFVSPFFGYSKQSRVWARMSVDDLAGINGGNV
jgi:hypothetical protein